MLPIDTDRLTIRPFRADEVDTFLDYHSSPELLQWMASGVPPERARVAAWVDRLIDAGGLIAGEFCNLAIEYDGEVVGDVGAEIRANGGIAEIGYSLRPQFRGQGFAGEAAGGLVDALIAHHGIHRFEASLAPDNVASMRVLESIGMQFEVLARDAFNYDGAWEDDLRYAMTANDRQAWIDRPRGRPSSVELVEIEPEEAYLWGRLATHYSEQRFVATMALTFRDALFPETFEDVPAIPWMRGILADGERAGFVMLSLTHGHSEGWYLWRLLVDRAHQRRGIGARAIELVVEELRRNAIPRLFTSYEDGLGTPLPFYLGLGFTPTGRIIDDEPELVLELA